MKRLALLFLCFTCLVVLADRRGQLMMRPQQASSSPSDVANLDLWLKADAITATNTATTDNWGVPDHWNDSTTNAHDFSYVGGVTPNRPSYNTSIQNGLPAVHFGAQSGLSSGYSISSGAFTMFLVAKLDDTSNAGRRAICGLSNWLLGPYSAHWQVYNGAFIQDSGGLDTAAHVFAVTTASAGATTFYNGGTNTVSGTNIASGWPGNMTIAWTSLHEPLLGYVCEICVYSRVLTGTELNTVFTSLKTKWGL